MRRRLILAAVAVTATIVIAFCVPLARLVSDIARDQAIAAAERDIERVAGALAVTTRHDRLTAVIASTKAGDERRLGVVLPDGSTLGVVGGGSDDIALARVSPSAFTVSVGDGIVLLTPVELADGVAVLRVWIPASEVERGVPAAWVILAGVAVVLLIVGVVIADRFASSITRPSIALAEASRRVADGDLAVRVTPSGPPELELAARGFNDLTGRLAELVSSERQGVADLAHRLRTPLAAMRLDVEAVGEEAGRERLLGDVTALEQAVDTVIREARRPIRQAMAPVSDLAGVVRDRVAFWSALADEQSRPLTTDIPRGVVSVGVPREELAAVIDALLDNVFTHTPAGTGFSVAVATAGSSAARLTVSDEGPGHRASAPSGTSAGRTGLGLDIARRAAEAGGGSLEVNGDHGFVVVLRLPLVTPDAAGPPVDHRRPHLTASSN